MYLYGLLSVARTWSYMCFYSGSLGATLVKYKLVGLVDILLDEK
jgi:hypothetical protein